MNLSLNIRLKAASILLICTILPMVANAEIDKKFYKKAAETVWGMNLPQFDPKADLSDSIFQNQSGIYIARYTSLDAKYSAEIDASKLSTIGLQNSNSTSAVYLRRTMVKLNDASAVEEFSEFSISEICYKSGFKTMTHFSKVFKTKFSQSPNSYKALLKET